MKRHIRLKVASPCPENWNEMKGDDARRFCGKCNKHVYQLSAMTSAEIEALLEQPGICARFYQRADGTVMTSDCAPARRKRRRKQAVIGIGAGLLSLAGITAHQAFTPTMGKVGPSPENIEPIMGEPIEVWPEPGDYIMGAAIAEPEGVYVMGDIAAEEVGPDGEPANDNAPPESE